MNKPNFRPIAPLDVDDDALERVNERLGVPTMVRPPARQAQQDVVTASRPTVPPPRRQQKLTVRIPGYLVDALKRGRLGATNHGSSSCAARLAKGRLHRRGI